jgi:hypothetical protein
MSDQPSDMISTKQLCELMGVPKFRADKLERMCAVAPVLKCSNGVYWARADLGAILRGLAGHLVTQAHELGPT